MDTPLSLQIFLPDQAPCAYPLAYGMYPAGSEPGNKLVIPHPSVARRHAILILRPEGCWVEDLAGRGRTAVGETPVAGRAAFLPGQEVRLGDCRLVVLPVGEAVRAPAKPAAESPPRAASPPPPAAARPEPARPEPPPQAASEATPAPAQGPDAGEIARRAWKCEIKRQIHAQLLERLDIKRLTVSQVREDELHERARAMTHKIIDEVRDKLPDWVDPEVLAKEVYDEAIGLGPLEDLIADPEISEIMVNQYDQIYVERHGRLVLSDRVFMDNASVLAVIERIVAPIGRRIDESQPYVDARLKDGSRVNAIIPPLALKGPCLTIRKFSRDPLTIEDLIRFKTLDRRMADFLRVSVKLRKNIIVSGGTGSGKTTFLNVISSFLPEQERIVTIEDAAELRLPQAHLVKLEARPANIEGRGEVSIRDLLRNALRMRPDRIVVGECRGGEALDMLQAMNTGHDGSITTVHANSPRDVISRLETMALMSGMDLPSRAIREQIGSAISLVVHTARLSDGSRKVLNITEITGLEGDRITMQDLFEFVQVSVDRQGKVHGFFRATGAVPTFIEDVKTRGLALDMGMFDPAKWPNAPE
jgi:pilus assembly protein CpaF